jgi:ferredoxin
MQNIVTADPKSCIVLLICEVEAAFEKYERLDEHNDDDRTEPDQQSSRDAPWSRECSAAKDACPFGLSSVANALIQQGRHSLTRSFL